MPVKFEVLLEKFGDHGDKTGWTYFLVPKKIAEKIKPGVRRSFRVKGKLDNHPVNFVALIPDGDGNFIFPVNAAMRKGLKKRAAAKIEVVLEEDLAEFVISPLLMECLAEEPAALNYFDSLLPSHRRYFSKWIDSAKTDETKSKRIAMAVSALSRGWGYSEMIRAARKE